MSAETQQPIPPHVIDEACTQLFDVVSKRVPGLRKEGAVLKACCPFHAEKTPSFTVNLHKGTWHCFGACKKGGDAIDFVQLFDGVSFREAVEIILGGGITRRTLTAEEQAKKEKELAAREHQREEAEATAISKSRRWVKKLHSGSHPLSATPAAAAREYLAGRYILPRESEKALPDCIRFHPRIEHISNRRAYPSLLVFAYDEHGVPVRAQAIFLEKIGGRWLRACHQGEKLSKLTYGHGCAHIPAILPGDHTRIIEAAGPETALSVWLSSDATVSVTFGDSCLGKANYPAEVQHIDFAGENDASNRAAIEAASAVYRAQGRRVGAFFPPDNLKDYNDLAAAVGGDREAVRLQIAAQNDHGAPLRAARENYNLQVRRDIAQALAWTPDRGPAPQVGSSTTPGVGKTHGNLAAIADIYREADAAGTPRPVIFYALPAHNQISDVEKRAQEDICKTCTSRRYVGKNQPDPRGKDGLVIDGKPQLCCPKVKLFERLKKAGIDAASKICGTIDNPCEYSPLHPLESVGCYTKFLQSDQDKVDFWWITTNMLFDGPPPGVERIDLLNKDEEQWGAGVTNSPHEYSIDTLSFIFDEPQKPRSLISIEAQEAGLKKTKSKKPRSEDDEEKESKRIEGIKAAYKECLEAHKIIREALDDLDKSFRASFTIKPGAVYMEHFKQFDATKLHYIAKKIFMYKLKFDVEANKDYSDDDLKAPREMFQRCAAISGCVEAIANALDDGHERNPYLHIIRTSGDNITLSLMKKKNIHEFFAKAPIIYTDATLPEKIARQFLPNLLVHEEITAPTRRFVRQTYDFAGAARNFTIMENSGDIYAEQHKVRMSVRRMHRIIKAQARQFESCGEGDYDLLIVCQLKLSEKLQALGAIPRVAFAHYNNLRGIDIYKTVAKVMLIGRLQPRASALARMASALFNRHIEVSEYLKTVEQQTDKRGKTVELTHWRAQDEDAEMLRQYICILEILQDIERGRSVLRSPDFPLHVDILTNIPLPIEVDQFISIKDLDADARDEEMLEEGVWLGSAVDRCRAFPDSWQARDTPALHARLERAEKITQTIDFARNRVPDCHNSTFLHSVSYRSNVELWPLADQNQPKSIGSVYLLTDRVNLWRHRTVIVEYLVDAPKARWREAGFDARLFPTSDAVLVWLDSRVGALADLRVIASPPWWWEPGPGAVCPDLRRLSAADRGEAVRLSLAQLRPTPQAPLSLEAIDGTQAPIRAAIWGAWGASRTAAELVAALAAAGLTLARHQGDEVVLSPAGQRFALAHSIVLRARQQGLRPPASLARDVQARLGAEKLPTPAEVVSGATPAQAAPSPKPPSGGIQVTAGEIIASSPISICDTPAESCYDPCIDETVNYSHKQGGAAP